MIARIRTAIARRRGTRFVYSDEFTGKFASREEALAAHADYGHDTDAEGQFTPGFRTYVRVEGTLAAVPAGSTVLDIGCNSGGLGRRLMEDKGCRMYGVDIAEHMVARAVEKGYEAYAGPAEELRYDDEMFDVVVASEILEHVHDPEPIIEQAFRVLKPGGLFLGDVPTEEGHWGTETIEDHEFHSRVFTAASLRELLASRFTVEAVEGVPHRGAEHPVYKVPTWYEFRARKEPA